MHGLSSTEWDAHVKFGTPEDLGIPMTFAPLLRLSGVFGCTTNQVHRRTKPGMRTNEKFIRLPRSRMPGLGF